MNPLGYPLVIVGGFLIRQTIVGRARDTAGDAKDVSLAFLSGNTSEVASVFGRRGTATPVGGSEVATPPTGTTPASGDYGGVKPWVARAGHEIATKFAVTDVGGVGGRGYESDHPKGLALDFMVGLTPEGKSKGNLIANYVVQNRRRLGVTYVIWYKRIFHTYGVWGPYYGTPDGNHSATALHMDHVHVSFRDKDPQA